MLPPVRIEPGPLMNLWSQVQHSPFWANWAFACRNETLGSLYHHALLIPTKSYKSKNQVMHKQKFKDLQSSTCPVSSERRVLDLDTGFFYFHVVKPLMEISALLPISSLWKPRLKFCITNICIVVIYKKMNSLFRCIKMFLQMGYAFYVILVAGNLL